MRLALFALTGIGNVVLASLCEAGRRPDLIITRRESGPHPYYPAPFIGDVASQLGIPCRVIGEEDIPLPEGRWDVGLIATFHCILPASVRARFGRLINLHPGLLPANRGASPIYWSIRLGERETGVTAHLVGDQIDSGDILNIRRVAISPEETQTTLRRKLARIAADIAVEALSGDSSPLPAHQAVAGPARPRFVDAMRPIDPAWSIAEAMRHARALRDYPLASFNGLSVYSVEPALTTTGAIVAKIPGRLIVRLRDADAVLNLVAEGAGPKETASLIDHG